jgi:hypothetical protein
LTTQAKLIRQKLKRRWFQFSLRRLMIVVTLFCVAGGYVCWQIRMVRDRSAVRGELSTKDWPHDLLGAFTMRDFYRLNVDPSTTPAFLGAKPELLAHGDPNQFPSVFRCVLGDEEVRVILLPNSVSDTEAARMAKVFPEADVWRWK